MRFMILVKATKGSEAGVMPSQELLTAMMQYNQALVDASVMLAGEGLHPSSNGARVRFSGSKRLVTAARSLKRTRSWPGIGCGGASRWRMRSSG